MKTYNNILFLLFSGIILLSSCTKQDGFKSSLHIVSFINPDEVFEVRVQRTAHVTDTNTDQSVNNAIVTIKNNSTGEETQMIKVGEGIYQSEGRKPLPGYDYEIQVKVDGYKDAAATTFIPSLDKVTINFDAVGNNSKDLEFSFSPTMLTAKPSNYFAYELIYDKPTGMEGGESTESGEIGEEVNTDTNPTSNAESIFSLKPVVGSIADGGESRPVQTVNSLDADISDISVRIVAVSSEFYDYLLINSQNAVSSSSSILTQNSPVYSNFAGEAYGIFGGFSEKTIKLMQ